MCVCVCVCVCVRERERDCVVCVGLEECVCVCRPWPSLSDLILNESLLQYSVGGAKVGSPAANPVKHTRMHDFSLSLTHTHTARCHIRPSGLQCGL